MGTAALTSVNITTGQQLGSFPCQWPCLSFCGRYLQVTLLLTKGHAYFASLSCNPQSYHCLLHSLRILQASHLSSKWNSPGRKVITFVLASPPKKRVPFSFIIQIPTVKYLLFQALKGLVFIFSTYSCIHSQIVIKQFLPSMHCPRYWGLQLRMKQ